LIYIRPIVIALARATQTARIARLIGSPLGNNEETRPSSQRTVAGPLEFALDQCLPGLKMLPY